MNYLYYPGCSLTASAREYDLATRALMTAVGANLTEIDGWTCCGASAAAPISQLLSLSLSARNLALAEQTAAGGQVLVPCSACYLNLKKAHEALRNNAASRTTINDALAAVNLNATGSVQSRSHPDIIPKPSGAHPDIIKKPAAPQPKPKQKIAAKAAVKAKVAKTVVAKKAVTKNNAVTPVSVDIGEIKKQTARMLRHLQKAINSESWWHKLYYANKFLQIAGDISMTITKRKK